MKNSRTLKTIDKIKSGYINTYEELFEPIKDTTSLEIGIGT
jgi:hypothetical protein